MCIYQMIFPDYHFYLLNREQKIADCFVSEYNLKFK